MSCQSVCDVAAPNEQTEKMRIVAMRARVRPARSATMPNTIPPTADVTSVTVPSSPAVLSLEAEVLLELPDGHHVQQEVHGIEHPPELRGGERAPLVAS